MRQNGDGSTGTQLTGIFDNEITNGTRYSWRERVTISESDPGFRRGNGNGPFSRAMLWGVHFLLNSIVDSVQQIESWFEMMTVNCVESMKGNTNDRCGGGEKQMEMKCLSVHLYMSPMQTEQNELLLSRYCWLEFISRSCSSPVYIIIQLLISLNRLGSEWVLVRHPSTIDSTPSPEWDSSHTHDRW